MSFSASQDDKSGAIRAASALIKTARICCHRTYADDGTSLGYQGGQFAWMRLEWDDDERRLTIEPNGGELESAERSLILEVIRTGE